MARDVDQRTRVAGVEDAPDTPGPEGRGHEHLHDLERIGTDPDPRFTWANERTFLAWNRTALALVAAGLAAAEFLDFNSRGIRLVIALPLIGLGAILSFTSYRRWERNERSLRLEEPLHYSRLPWLVGMSIAAIALVAAVVAVVDVLTR